jgi:hypothetical protein
MKIFIDESGQFSLPPTTDRLVMSGAMGVVMAESCEESVTQIFEEFKRKLSPEEMPGGEVKGNKLTNASREIFLDSIVVRHTGKGLLLAPVVVDDSIVEVDKGALRSDSYANRFKEITTDAPDEDSRGAISNIEERVRQLSDVQLRRLHTWGLVVKMSIQAALLDFGRTEFDDCWHEFRIEIDGVEHGANDRESIVFKRLISAWLSCYDAQVPFRVYDEDLRRKEAGIRKLVTPDNTFHWKAIIDSNIFFVDSRYHIGIQIADICSNIAHRAYRNIDRSSFEHDLFRKIMLACPYSEDGVIFHVSSDLSAVGTLRKKYSHILPPFR